MQSLKEVMWLIDQEADYTTDNGLIVRVKIVDLKSSYGKVRYLISPVTGSGTTWVEVLTNLPVREITA
jgi:hypothetical protein